MSKFKSSIFHHFLLVVFDWKDNTHRYSFSDYKTASRFFNKLKNSDNYVSGSLYGVYSQIWMPEVLIKSF